MAPPDALAEALEKDGRSLVCTGLQGSEKAYLLSRIYHRRPTPMVVTAPTPREALAFCENLRFFMGQGQDAVRYFPAYNLMSFTFLASHNETAADRLRALYHLMAGSRPAVLVTPVAGLLKKIIPRAALQDYAELAMAGEEIDRDSLVEKLHAGGYEHAAIVEEPGDYCVRGGILDVFSPLYHEPLRIEMFGDLVDTIRFFSPVSQRTRHSVDEAVILPAKEAIVGRSQVESIAARVRRHAARLNLPVTPVRKVVDRLKNEGMFPGAEQLMALIHPELETLFDYLPADGLFVLVDDDGIEKAVADTEQQVLDHFQKHLEEGLFCVDPGKMYMDQHALQQRLTAEKNLKMRLLPVVDHHPTPNLHHRVFDFKVSDNGSLRLAMQQGRRDQNPLKPLVDWIEDHRQNGGRSVIACAYPSQAEKMRSVLKPYGVPLMETGAFPQLQPMKNGRKHPLYLCVGALSSGFSWPEAGLTVVTDSEIFGTRKRKKSQPAHSVQRQLLAFEDLKSGDLVVHDEHGIGQYQGLIKLTVEGAANDYLLVTYRDNDRLYLPVDRMNRLTKYMGVDGVVPVVDKMGGKAWDKVKKSARRSAEKIAGELLKIYAARKVKNGFAFAPFDLELEDFENGFPYEETADQAKVIEDVLADMEQPQPMDRLVCGDVGYGKTEVALRASFVALLNGKQVAVLVPTTVLAEQHFATFSKRFADQPVSIACLSRFRTPREQRKIVSAVKEGRIDIVIGTHRLLQKDVDFKDLGLFVIDEEQRFGVKHKERLKKIRTTVDVLALTATPIPRTLHMSLTGVRDISLIATPPAYRHAIVTYVCEFDEGIVRDAILKELKRNGQIFFVHNTINSIERLAARLKTIVPEVRLDVAHGRMAESDLEKVMMRFVRREIDLLVCTTIIESGLDIPSANTILINRADRFGLAQIYQLRGRVGRAEEQAYAYLFIPQESALTRDAQKRLKVLMEYSDLGSGFQIAMSDLKIRGGGTILGASQSGHIAAVGYDMFLQLMEESIEKLKGMPRVERLEPEINVPMSAYIPETYVHDIDQRLSLYRRLVKISSAEALADLKKELLDRFGELPQPAAHLLLKIVLKVWSLKAGVKRLDVNASQLALHLSPAHQKKSQGVVDMVMKYHSKCRLTPDHIMTIKIDKTNDIGKLTIAKNILKEMAQRVNG